MVLVGWSLRNDWAECELNKVKNLHSNSAGDDDSHMDMEEAEPFVIRAESWQKFKEPLWAFIIIT